MAAADFCPCARLAVCAEPAGLHANLWFSFAVQFAVYRNGRPAFTLCALFSTWSESRLNLAEGNSARWGLETCRTWWD